MKGSYLIRLYVCGIGNTTFVLRVVDDGDVERSRALLERPNQSKKTRGTFIIFHLEVREYLCPSGSIICTCR